MKKEINAQQIWQSACEEAEHDAQKEPLLTDVFKEKILQHPSLEDAICAGLAEKLATAALPASKLTQALRDIVQKDSYVQQALCADLIAVRQRDRACQTFYTPLLFFRGFQGLQAFRMANALYKEGRQSLAFFLQSRISEVFGMDIHPAAQLGAGLVFDHGLGIVIGETAVVGDDVFMFHNITLGSTGKESGDRHPKIGKGVLIGAGATLLGNIAIGRDAVIAAGSVVLQSVPSGSVAAGVPARVIGKAGQVQGAVEIGL